MVLFVGFYQWSLAVIEMFDYLRCATNPPHKQINKIPGYASILNWRNYWKRMALFFSSKGLFELLYLQIIVPYCQCIKLCKALIYWIKWLEQCYSQCRPLGWTKWAIALGAIFKGAIFWWIWRYIYCLSINSFKRFLWLKTWVDYIQFRYCQEIKQRQPVCLEPFYF